MKKSIVLLITGCLLGSLNGLAQALTCDLEDKDTTVVAGSNVQIYGHLLRSDEVVYSCAARVTNINLPANWDFTLCNPFICLVQGNDETFFTYPDVVNYNFDNEGLGIEAIKLTVMTTPGNATLTGEMDLTFENITSGETITRHIIVRTNGQSVSIDENDATALPTIYPVPVSDELQIVDCQEGTFYTILDNSGRVIMTGITIGNIDCSQLNSGNYFIQITEKGKTGKYIFRKI